MTNSTLTADTKQPQSVWLIAGAAVAVLAAIGAAILVARPAAGPSEVSMLASAILGVVEGLSEYLPISSTGHLLITQKLLGLGGTDTADAALDSYAICIQAGAILAVLLLYRERVISMVQGLFGRSETGRHLLIAVIAAFVPTVVIALALESTVKDKLFGPAPIAWAWLVGGLVILWLDRMGRLNRPGLLLEQITVRHAVIIGVAQAIALWPGVSRSLVTIVAAVLVGLSLSAAVEFSFILGLITLTAATAFEGLKNGQLMVDTFGAGTLVLGLVVAFVFAALAVKWMVAWLEERGFAIFGWYRIAIGVVTLAVLAIR